MDGIGAREVVDALGMQPHPEGGWYLETWRAASVEGGRAAGSAILYLLAAGERSHWHRLDAGEVWQYSAGDPLELRLWTERESGIATVRLGGDVTAGSVAQAAVPVGAWQTARTLGGWTLVGCFMAPAFDFVGFELAPPGWDPPVR